MPHHIIISMFLLYNSRWTGSFQRTNNSNIRMTIRRNRRPFLLVTATIIITTTTTTTVINYKHKVREDKRKSDRPLQPTTRQYLKEFYQPYNQELAELLAGKTKNDNDWSVETLNWN
mmetsp:Transcript_20910/g.24137  ORF Transcript_20910/g.24137 Transcript_20910/m.24137 type:complete len:117 (+) Transcript_20910:771-1121(+)